MLKTVLLSLVSLTMEDVTSNIRPMQQLVLGSYNCRGLTNSFKRDYVSSLLDSCDFLFIKEHWLSDTQLAQLNFISKVHFVTGISGFGDRVLQGRPYGGCAIFWRCNLNATATLLSTNSRRVCAVRM